jgi:3-phosphoshikimate 1-carboxyvinyltransferase
MRIELPISKSIANRLLILQAIHGDGLLSVSDSMPDDVRIMSEAIRLLGERREARIDLGNCGTAMRFLTAYCAQLEGQTTILDGVERMHHRPIGQLVDALREIGADIEYLGEEGFPPLRIKGKALDKSKPITLNTPQSTQFISALLLIGANVQTNSTSPYIDITREMIKNKEQGTKNKDKLLTTDQTQVTNLGSLVLAPYSEIERDWSSAAFWYEYVALHGGEITLPGLSRDSLQGDKIVADIFAHLGIHTTYTAEGITLSPIAYSEASYSPLSGHPIAAQAASRSKILVQDFGNCPDLYPAVALTCERLGIELHATGVESLPLKESDRLRAVREHRTDADHRMAMALLIAGYEVDDTTCICKSYPRFLKQWKIIQNP